MFVAVFMIVVMTAVRRAPGGQQVEQTEHGEPESAGEGDQPEIRGEILVDARAGIEIEQHPAPHEQRQGMDDAPGSRVHFAGKIRCCQRIDAPPMAMTNPIANPMMNRFRITV